MDKIEKILFVDDDSVCAYLNTSLVEELEIAKQVISLQNAFEALKYLQQHYTKKSLSARAQPDLIFLDIRMPGMDGFEFLQELDKLKELDKNQFKIIMLTALLHPSDKEKATCYRDKVFACLSKPLAKEDIVELLALGAIG